MKTRAESAEVLYPIEHPVVAGVADIAGLKRAALASPRRRARICTHGAPSDRLHEMLIVLTRDSYVRPHKHLVRAESFTVLEGEVDVLLFEEDGRLRAIIPMGSYGSGHSFYYRLAEPVFHTLRLRSDLLVFHEVTEGPFRPDQTIAAPWAPSESDAPAVAAWHESLRHAEPSTPMVLA